MSIATAGIDFGIKVGRPLAKGILGGAQTIANTRPVRFAARHPIGTAAIAASAGVAVTRPIHNISSQIGTSFEQDPNYFRKLMIGSSGLAPFAPGAFGSQPGYGANIMTTGNTAGITTQGSMGLSANPDPDQMLRMNEQAPGTNPSGAIIFGLYSNRLR